MVSAKFFVRRIIFPFALLFGQVAANAADIHLVTENYPPFNFLEDGEIVGVGPDQAREIMHRVGIDYSLELMPWSRAYWLAENKKNYCVLTTAITPARKNSFSWVSPLGGAELLLIKKTGAEVPQSVTEIARDFTVGTQRNDLSEYVLQNNGFSNIDYFDDVEAVIRQVLQGRLDLAAISSMTFYRLEQQGADVELVHGFGDVIGNGIACNKETDATVIRRMQDALDQIITEGKQMEILRKHAGNTPDKVISSKN